VPSLGEHLSVVALLPSPVMVSHLISRVSACDLIFRDPNVFTAGEIPNHFPRWDRQFFYLSGAEFEHWQDHISIFSFRDLNSIQPMCVKEGCPILSHDTIRYVPVKTDVQC